MSYKNNNETMLAAGVLALGFIATVIFLSLRVVPVGHVGIVMSFGRITGTSLEPGLHFTSPWHVVIQAGHSGMTIRNASDKLKVLKKKVDNRWHWSLPKGGKPPKPCQVKSPVRKPKRRPRRVVITISLE